MDNFNSVPSEANGIVSSKLQFIEGFPYSNVTTTGNWTVYSLANDPDKKIAKLTWRGSVAMNTSTAGVYMARKVYTDLPFDINDIQLIYAKGGAYSGSYGGQLYAQIRSGVNTYVGIYRSNTTNSTVAADVDVYLRNFTEGAI